MSHRCHEQTDHGRVSDIACILTALSVGRCADKPGKPGTPEVKEATKSSATLTWKPPTDNGGSEITNYVLEYRADGAFRCVASARLYYCLLCS